MTPSVAARAVIRWIACTLCCAFTLFGQSTGSAPVASIQPLSSVEVAGGNVAFVARAISSLPLRFQWHKDGQPIPGASQATLFLPSVPMSASGSYACVVGNSAGSVQTATARLSILPTGPTPDPIDPTFAPDLPVIPTPLTAAAQADGKLLLGGSFAFTHQSRQYAGLIRLNPDGSLDPTFASVVPDVSGSVYLITLQPDGRIIVAGVFAKDGGPARNNLARLNTDGSIDRAFTGPATVGGILRQVELTAEGRLILVDGSTRLMRLNSDGSVDPTWRFAPVEVAAGSGTSIGLVTCTVERIAVLPDSRIAAVVTTPPMQPSNLGNPFSPPPPPSRFSLLWGLNPDGSRFGSLISGTIPDSPLDLRTLAGGGLLLTSGFGSLVRFDPTASGGSFTLSTSARVSSPTSVAIGADGHVWVAGNFTSATDRSGLPAGEIPAVQITRNTIVRLRPDLSVESFDAGSGLTDSAGNAAAPRVLVPQPDGRVVAVGDFFRVNGTVRPQVARLGTRSSGALNPAEILDVAYRPPIDGESYVVTVRVTGSPPFYFPAGYVYDAAAGTAMITFATAGRKFTRAANSLGAGPPREFTVTAAPSPPAIVDQPDAVQTNSGRRFRLAVRAVGSSPLTYQWFKDGNPLPGAVLSELAVDRGLPPHAGDYHVVVRNSLGAAASATARVGIDELPRLVNFSARATLDAADPALVLGFVVQGADGKGLLIRGVGPTLAAAPFNTLGALGDPTLAVFDSTNTTLLSNDNWTSSRDVTPLGFRSVAQAVGAFPLREASADAAGWIGINAGGYTARISSSGLGGGALSGIALAEIYETDSNSARLINLSARARVEPGNRALIAGFVVAPIPSGAPKKLLLRGVGPALAAFGVSQPLPNPVLRLVDNAGRNVASNDDWELSGNLADLVAETARVAYPLGRGARDSALFVSIPAGAYSCIVSTAENSGGTALVEIYELP